MYGVKLLDFGLAKLRPRSSTPDALTAAPTKSPLTGQGSVMGTFQYMAPEQIEGQEADARTDIFAFGVVLYEMLTGKRAFEGKSQASVISAILNADPPALSQLQPATPPALDRIVRKCLAKDPDRRWDSARDLADELRWVADLRAQSAPVPSASSWWLIVGSSVLAAAALGALTVFWLRGANGPVMSEPIQFAINPPSADTLVFDSTGPTLAISPDGQTVVFVATRNGTKQVYRRRLGELRSDPVDGTENASNPFFSSDGRSIGFFTGNAIKKVLLEGGESIAVQENLGFTLGGQATWGTRGTVFFAGGSVGSSVEQVVTSGGAAHPLTVRLPDQSEYDHEWPDVLPGEQAILFSVDYAGSRPPEVFVQSLSSGERRHLVQGFAPRYSASGHLVFMRDTVVWAVGFDRDRLQIIGQPTPIVRGVRSGQFAISANGTLAYAAQPIDASRTLVWVDALGNEELLAVPPQLYRDPRLSPDGRRLALATDGGDAEVWIYDFDRKTLRQLTVNPSVDQYPLWTLDGSRIVFSSARGGGPRNLYWQAADGSGAVERLTTSSLIQSPWAWSPDGGTLVFQQLKAPPSQDWDIHTFSIQQRRSQPLLQTDVVELDPQVSPNGKWLAYRGNGDVWVRPFPNVEEGRWRLTTKGGGEPKWSADGKHLYFRGANSVAMFSVDVTESPGFSAGTPKRLFDLLPYVVVSGGRNYDVAADGRFLMRKEVGGADRTASPATLVVIVNWAQRLNRLLSTK